MCGRYYIAEDEPMSRVLGDVIHQSELQLGEIYPTSLAPIILPGGEVQLSFWGFPRYDGKGQIINARSETVAEKKMFLPALQKGRCLIPASWYFEWQTKDGKKIKHAFLSPSEPVLYLAGISQIDSTTGERRFVILTRQAVDHLAHIHDRMPLILPISAHDAWLHGREHSSVLLQEDVQMSYHLAN